MRRSRAFTLMEMLVVVSVSAIAISAIVTVFEFVMRQSARVGSQASIGIQISDSIERMRPTIRDAVVCSTVALANGTTGLQCTMPKDLNGMAYIPYRVDAAGKPRYRTGDSYLFYLSDSTGNQSHTGTILWRATEASGAVVWSIDSSWSLYYGGAGRILSVSAFTPTIDSTGHKVTLSITFTETYGGSALSGAYTAGSNNVTLSRQFYYRNWKT